ncbi:MAG: hypothetical protein WD431_12295 [Cyclobacteriaceae bacterium]
MKGFLCIGLVLLAGLSKAQKGSHYLSFQGGVGVPLLDMSGIGYEFNSQYHRRHEVFLEWMKTRETAYQTLLLGLMIKPVMFRSKATILRFRIGSALGTDLTGILLAPLMGWELTRIFYRRLELCIGNRNQLLLWASRAERWRVVLDAGVKIPLN